MINELNGYERDSMACPIDNLIYGNKMNDTNLRSTPRRSSLVGGAASWVMTTLPMLAVLIFGSAVFAQDVPERPATEDLLPETTVAFLQIDNVQETLPKLMGSEILQDENVAPLVERMFKEAETVYQEATEDKVDITIEQIKNLPSGEICIAVIAPRRQDLEYLVAVEIDPESESAELVGNSTTKWAEALADKGLTETIEANESGLDIYTYDIPDAPRQAHAFVRDGWFVSCTSKDELSGVLARWEGLEVDKVRALSENRKFITIMNRCRATDDIQPEIRFFLDPISMSRSGFRGNKIAMGVMAFLPKAGLDGILALGGSVSLQGEEFKSVVHGHLLLANPRSGLLNMMALKPGESDPQPFVPADVTSYMSTHWDPMQAVDEFEKFVDTFSGEGEFRTKVVEQLKAATSLDFYQDIVKTTDGRLTYLSWQDPESEFLLSATSNAIALGVTDTDKAKEVVDALLKIRAAQGASGASESEHEGVAMWVFDPLDDERKKLRDERTKERVGDLPMRFSEPAFCLLDGSLVIANSVDMVKHLINVSLGKAPALAENEEYSDQMRTLFDAAGADFPCAVTFYDPERPLDNLFKLMGDERSKTMLDKLGEKNPMRGRFQGVLAEQPLPDFELIKKYFRPTGTIVTTDDTGYHMLAFQYGAEEE